MKIFQKIVFSLVMVAGINLLNLPVMGGERSLNLEVTQEYNDGKPEIDHIDDYGRTQLDYAIWGHDINQILRLIQDHGATVSTQNLVFMSRLRCEEREPETLNQLLELPQLHDLALIDAREGVYFQNPLISAIKNINLVFARHFLSAGADINVFSPDSGIFFNPLHYTVMNIRCGAHLEDWAAFAEDLIYRGVDAAVGAQDEDGNDAGGNFWCIDSIEDEGIRVRLQNAVKNVGGYLTTGLK